MKITLIAFLIAACGVANAAPTDEQCAGAAELAKGALEARQAGVTEEVAMEYLRHQGVYSGLPVWAVKQGYNAPADVSAWMLGGFVFSECKRREE
jgi:hypothetical protein